MTIENYLPGTTEKVGRLLTVLGAISRHPQFRGNICLHGGTALNLFAMKAPRMSIDADINYIGSPSSGELDLIKTANQQALLEIAHEMGYTPLPGAIKHAGQTIKLLYVSQSTGARDFVKVDLDYLNRVPLLPFEIAQSSHAGLPKISFPINAPIEIAAGKIKALFERVVPRDLYDVRNISRRFSELTSGDKNLDRKILLYYTSIAQPFPRKLVVKDRFIGREKELRENLYPVLLDSEEPNLIEMIDEVESFIESEVAPKTPNETLYLQKFANGLYKPELLFDEESEIAERASRNPAALWKIKNLRLAEERAER